MKEYRSLEVDSALVLRASQGDEAAFATLCAAYRPGLVSLAMRMLRQPDDAHDAVQETFLKAFRAIHEFDPERPLKPWLFRICSNCCVDTVRARRRAGEGFEGREETLQDETGVADRAEGSIQRSQIMEAIGRLPENYRRIILMRHFRHMDVTEIAQALDKPEGTVKSWLFRARALLRKDLMPAMG